MITVVMDKDVTIMKELDHGKTHIVTKKYKDLESSLSGENEITVNYIYADLKRRIKLLTGLGYSLKQTIFFNNDAPYSRIKEVWSRKKGA